MANIFKRKLSRDVGNVAVAVGSYTVASNTTVVVVGLTVCNTTGSTVNTSIFIDDGANDTYILKDAPIPGGGSLVAIGGDQKVILETGDSVKVISDAVTSLDVTMSIMEIS
jgi:hypothetical protein